jgi:hypothetical protein
VSTDVSRTHASSAWSCMHPGNRTPSLVVGSA